MNYLEYAKNNLLMELERPEYIAYATGNPYAEVDREHFLNVGDLVKKLWIRKIGGNVPVAPIIAGWFHDFDRAFVKIRVPTYSVEKDKYRDKKIEHSKNSAKTFAEHNPDLPPLLVSDVKYIIERVEIGGIRTKDGAYEDKVDSFTKSYNINRATDIVKEVDGLSFFEVIIYSYVKWADENRVRNKIRFSFDKLSEMGKSIVREMEFRDKHITKLVRESIQIR